MKIQTKNFIPTISYDLTRLGDPERLLFFDIETTGLSPKLHQIYLIGVCYVCDGSWVLKQWFAESAEEEKEILLHFLAFCGNYDTIIHFNGDTFDLPFVKLRAEKYELPWKFHIPNSLDLLKHTRPLKKALRLPDCRQKTLEWAFGIGREDLYNGGELIAQYETYTKTKEPELYRNLILHNEEDIQNLPSLIDVLLFEDLNKAHFTLDRIREESYFSYQAKLDGLTEPDQKELLIEFHLDDLTLPAFYQASDDLYRLEIRRNRGVLRLSVFSETLKLFFPNTSDYYYLPAEDRAIHKSVAAFVDKSAKKKATKKNCYQPYTGEFIPAPGFEGDDFHIFRKDYKTEPAFLLRKDADFSRDAFLNRFLLALLSQ